MVILNAILDALTNYVLVSAFFGWLVAQILKVFTGIFRKKNFSVVELFFGTGGMPSSHTAAVTSLACAVSIKLGFGSSEFAMCAILAMIVMRDATGMRRQVGEQAKALNLILQELFESKDPVVTEKALNELAGHTPLQVVAGAVVGIIVPFIVDLVPIFV